MKTELSANPELLVFMFITISADIPAPNVEDFISVYAVMYLLLLLPVVFTS